MIVLVLVAIAAFAFLVWWLIFETEGVYLGRGMVIWLYDVYAQRYDGIKEFDDYADFMLISQPIMERIHPHDDPMMLDVATGTGRVPMIMARNPEFYGHVVGVDLSSKMLAVAQEKVADQHFEDFITLMVENGQALPFVDASFDVVTCLEALEFMPSPDAVLHEMCRVLRPGGILLTTIRIDTRWMPDRTWDEETMREKLLSCGMRAIAFEIWQADYTKVWAIKAGDADFGGVCVVDDIMKVGALTIE